MLESLSLPWWAIVYLVIFFGLTFADAMIDMRERPTALVGDTISFLFAVVCVLAYYNMIFASKLGFFLLPMVFFGLAWEFVQSVKGANRAEQEMLSERDITEQERTMLLNIGVGLGAAVTLPAYMMGLKACVDLITGSA